MKFCRQTTASEFGQGHSIIEKCYYDPLYNTPYSEPDGFRVYIITQCSLTAQNYWTILSGAGAHGKCATFDVWVEANGPEFIELDEILDRFVKPSNLLQ